MEKKASAEKTVREIRRKTRRRCGGPVARLCWDPRIERPATRDAFGRLTHALAREDLAEIRR